MPRIYRRNHQRKTNPRSLMFERMRAAKARLKELQPQSEYDEELRWKHNAPLNENSSRCQ